MHRLESKVECTCCLYFTGKQQYQQKVAGSNPARVLKRGWKQISPGRLVHEPIICPATPNSHLNPSLLNSEPETRASGLAQPTHRVDSPTASPPKQDSSGYVHPSNLDAADIDDPLMAAEYVVDIQRYHRQAEDTTLLSRLPARSDLVHASVHTASGLSETLFLCANLTDRFLSTRLVSPARGAESVGGGRNVGRESCAGSGEKEAGEKVKEEKAEVWTPTLAHYAGYTEQEILASGAPEAILRPHAASPSASQAMDENEKAPPSLHPRPRHRLPSPHKEGYKHKDEEVPASFVLVPSQMRRPRLASHASSSNTPASPSLKTPQSRIIETLTRSRVILPRTRKQMRMWTSDVHPHLFIPPSPPAVPVVASWDPLHQLRRQNHTPKAKLIDLWGDAENSESISIICASAYQ
ncbi:hypothetical protein B0H13DRAFT_2676903 [Mycena leptocephala]|nr:hypothetical protein B0H13DRAFT_2676903 [Mycena leptocephala]